MASESETPRYFRLPQVISLTCGQLLNPVEVELVFLPFSSNEEPDTYTVTCRTAGNHLVRTSELVIMADTLVQFELIRTKLIISASLQVYVEPIDHSACAPDCKISLRLIEDPRGYDITLRANRNGETLDAKTFHFGKYL